MAQAGAWLNYAVPVRPVRGQMLALRTEKPICGILFLVRQAICFQEAMLSWLGRQEKRLVLLPRPQRRDCNDYGAIAYVYPAYERVLCNGPGLACALNTPDSRPGIGILPGWDNVLLAAGHNSLGRCAESHYWTGYC